MSNGIRYSPKEQSYSVINVLQYGAFGNGTTNDTTAIQNAINAAGTLGLPVYLPAGTYLTTSALTIEGAVMFTGDGAGKTIITPSGSISALIINTSGGQGPTRPVIEGFSIYCSSASGTGIEIGNTGGTATRSTHFRDIRIIDAKVYGIRLKSGIQLSFERVIVEDGLGEGLFIDNENNVTSCTFTQCSFRQNNIGMRLNSGNRLTFISSVIESNKTTGLRIDRRNTNGFSNSKFIGCWFENNGHTPTSPGTGIVASIYTDMLSTVAQTHQTDLFFDTCIITSPSGAYDLSIDRGNNLLFQNCSFSASASNGFTSSKFRWSTGAAAAFAMLKDCGSLNELASPTLYANFPAISVEPSISGYSTYGQLGIAYEYTYKNRLYTNVGGLIGRTSSPVGSVTPARRGELLINTTTNDVFLSNGVTNTSWIQLQSNNLTTIAAAGDTTPSVSGVNKLILNNSSGTTITQFDNGVASQELHCVILNGNTTIQNNANIKLDNSLNFTTPSGGTLSLLNYSGVWYETARAIF